MSEPCHESRSVDGITKPGEEPDIDSCLEIIKLLLR